MISTSRNQSSSVNSINSDQFVSVDVTVFKNKTNHFKLCIFEYQKKKNIYILYILVKYEGEPRLELGVHRLWNNVELFWNSLDNAPPSIVFYLEMKVEVEIGVHDIRPRFITRLST